MTAQSKRATAGTVTPQMDALAGAPMSNHSMEMTMNTNTPTRPGGATRDRTRPTDWSEFDDMLTCAGDVDNMIEALWLIAGNKEVPGHITGAMQQVATAAMNRLYGLRTSLEGYMEDAKS